jgi:SRSO17 transposase
MNQRELKRLDEELREYLEKMLGGLGNKARRASAGNYVLGLLLDGDRKSIQPMAARLVDDASEVEAMRQRLQECVVIARWSDDGVRERLAMTLDRELPGVEALVIDDTGFPKKGEHSVGVQRQYSGTLGRVDNCQVATSLHLASEQGSGCIGMRLYLPEEWARDAARRMKAGISDEIEFKEKWRIALALIDDAIRTGVRKHVTLGDAGYGDCGEFRIGLDERKLPYVLGISGVTVVWPPGSNPAVQKKPKGPGRPVSRYRDDRCPPLAISQLASQLDYRKVSWREGSRGWQSSRFAAARIRTAHRHQNGEAPGPEQWLLCQWFEGEKEPTKFWLSSLPKNASLHTLVRLAKLRWRIERDYQELKQEIGLDHFEGRTWRGFHHHATLCSVAHAFLALRRALFPPGPSEMDAADGETPPATAPAAMDRNLPPLPPAS